MSANRTRWKRSRHSFDVFFSPGLPGSENVLMVGFDAGQGLEWH